MAANDMNAYNTSSSAFRYQKVLEKGKPVHDKNDFFSIRHPAMALSQRAKIFSPFTAALKGYHLTSSESLCEKFYSIDGKAI